MVALDTAQPAQRTNECELCRAEVDGNTEPHLLRKRNATLGLGLYFIEPIARREKVRGHVLAAERRKDEVTDLVGGLKRAAHHVAANPDMFCPRQDNHSKIHVGPGLKALQPALFDEFIAEPPESISRLVVAELRSGEQAKVYIGEARGVTVQKTGGLDGFH